MRFIFEASLGSPLGFTKCSWDVWLSISLVSRVEGYLGIDLQTFPSSFLFSIILEKGSSFMRYSNYSWFPI